MIRKPAFFEGAGRGFLTLFMAVLWYAAVQGAQSGRIIELADGRRCFDDRLVVTLHPGSPQLELYAKNRPTTGLAELDRTCALAHIDHIEKWYKYPLRSPNLRSLADRMYVFFISEDISLADAAAVLRRDSNIELAEPYSIPMAYYTPNDPYRTVQWHLTKTQAYAGWDLIRGDTTRYCIIGIVDTGVYWDHPDLAANMWVNALEDLNHNGTMDAGDLNSIDNDGNGYVDDVIGWDFGSNDNNPAEPSPIHGTHVAGCASEVTDNGIGGAAVGFRARIMAVKGADNYGNLIAVWQGVLYASDMGARVINCSWGSPGYSQYEQNVITHVRSEGTLVVAAAGNDDYWTPPYVNYPAAYTYVLAVAATDNYDHKASFSNYGTWVDVSAPGTNIYTTWGQYNYSSESGTSMASPIVAGLAALIKALKPTFTPDSITKYIKNYADTIDHLNPAYAGMLGTGRINCFASLSPLAYVAGDVNGNGSVEGADVTYLTRYLKGTGDPPPPPLLRADANGNCLVQGSDVTYLVNYFKGGAVPQRCSGL